MAGWEAWLLSGGLIFLGTLTRNLALARMKAAIFSSLYLLSPVFSAIMGVVILHEQIALVQWAGGALILGGGYLLIRLSHHAPSKKAASHVDVLASTDALLDFYKFHRAPFNVTSDPDVALLSPNHEQALAAIRHGLEARRGFTAILGETGVGKTTLIRTCMARMAHPQVKFIYLPHAHLSFSDVLAKLCQGLNIEPRQATIAGMLSELEGALIDAYNKEYLVTLVIDDVQCMPPETLQSLRMLLNFEMPKAKLLQLVLCGHPEVEQTWNHPDLAPLKSCLAMRATIEPLTLAESKAYIQHRLAIATRRLTPVFTESALKRIVRHTAGIPRLINTVCNNALLEGFVYHQNPVTAALVKRAMANLAGLTPRPGLTQSLFFFLGLCVGAVLLAGLLATPWLQSLAISLRQTWGGS